MLYHWYEMNRAAMRPARYFAQTGKAVFTSPLNPMAHTFYGRKVAAACQLFERSTRRYGKPEFGIDSIKFNKEIVEITENIVWKKPFCRLIHFERESENPKNIAAMAKQPKVLLVAPMSGHYATLLRGTVETMLPDNDVYITDWADARMVPLSKGRFDLCDYISYLIDMFNWFEGDVHVIAVCQPSVPVMAAVSVMEKEKAPHVPMSMTLMGGPIDTRANPTAVNDLAIEKGKNWFARNVLSTVPWFYPGVGRRVYPGFLQLYGFMAMNLDMHLQSHKDLYMNLIRGDGESVEKHKEFYNEYLAVMDLTGEFYLQTIDTVFIKHALPEGTMKYRGKTVDPKAIKRVALMTIEGEKDDITGLGQTEAAQKLCSNLPDNKKLHYVQPNVGHYGVFNGSKFRKHIYPRMMKFMAAHDRPTRSRKQRANGKVTSRADKEKSERMVLH